MAGRVRVDGRPVDKPGANVAEDADVAVRQEREYVSRGGLKLVAALERPRRGRDRRLAPSTWAPPRAASPTACSSAAPRASSPWTSGTGSWTGPCGAIARVHVMERTNARHLSPGDLPYAPDLVTCDLSFISVGTVWGAVVPCLAPGWRAMVMVKPQFEVGPRARRLGRRRARRGGPGGRRARRGARSSRRRAAGCSARRTPACRGRRATGRCSCTPRATDER